MMKAKDLNLSVNASQINKSKDSTHLELLKTDVESKDSILQKSLKSSEKVSPSKSGPKSNDNNDISFCDMNKNGEIKMDSPIPEEPEKEKETSPQKKRNSINNDDLVCEPSFCENDSMEKHPSLKQKNSNDLELDPYFLKQLGFFFKKNGFFEVFLFFLEENNMKESAIMQPIIKEFPKEENKEKAKEKEGLLPGKMRSNDYETTKDNTMASTTCATKIGIFSKINKKFKIFLKKNRKLAKFKNQRICSRKGNEDF